VRIRQATHDDQPGMVAMGLRFIATTGYAAFPSTPEALGWILAVVLEHGVAYVAEEAGRLVGMLAVVVAPHPLTGEPYADEVVWWVEPEYRSGSLGPRLLQTVENWTVTKGVTALRMVAPNETAVGKFYERRGYVPIETSYLKRL
jgi:GNAT superfamily N-acetyltransferase